MQVSTSEQMGGLTQFLPMVHGNMEQRFNSGLSSAADAYRVLILEGSSSLARLLATGLSAEAPEVEVSADLDEAMQMLHERSYQLLILDMDLKDVNGVALLRRLRAEQPDMRVLVLSGQAGVEGLVTALDEGADDYLLKPFSLLEMMARVRAMRRRWNHSAPPRIPASSKVVLHRERCQVERGGRMIDLTPREFSLLEFMMQHAGQTLSRAMLVQEVWNTELEPTTNIVDVYVKYLRDKVDEGHSEKLIRTIRGRGYMFQTQA